MLLLLQRKTECPDKFSAFDEANYQQKPQDSFVSYSATGRDVERFSFYRLCFHSYGDSTKWIDDAPLTPATLGASEQELKQTAIAQNLSLVDKWQKKRLYIRNEYFGKKDYMFANGPYDLPEKFHLEILLVSKRVKEALTQADFTGFRFEPCLLIGEQYSEEIEAFGAEVPEGDHNFADFYQLVVTEVTQHKLRLGNFNKGYRPYFRDTYDANMPSWYYLEPEDLAQTDIQMLREGGIPIFSGRLYKFLLKNKFRGFLSWTIDTPNEIIPIRKEPYDDSINHGHWDKARVDDYLAKLPV